MFVLDASAVIAVLLGEDGAEFVINRMRGAEMSIVNVGEVLTRAVEGGADPGETLRILETYQFRTRAFREAHAIEAARLRPATKPFGLGFGDRACLVQGMFSAKPILTGDRDWIKLDLGLDIRLIR